ncbi:MAG: aminotransferase class I/II-fold pyridoxal phosphate-dependent enzyme [Rhodospirillaceae bacterium]|nr:MAG: aminotransferase class I/II-fold pyridoxal phosphate-dependent enzyme [Rhodospirillaceae bacterium]
MAIKIARRGLIPPFIVMDVMRDAARLEAEGRHILHLEVGQPSTGLPAAAAARVRDLVGRDTLGYTVAAGIPELRTRIAHHYGEAYGAKVDPEQIFVTTGSSTGFLLAFLAAFEAGDRVALATPGYPAYRHILTALGVVPELIEVGAETRYQPTVAHLRRLSSLPDGLILASPANPSGTVIPPAEFQELADFCEAHGIRLISDEIYHGLTYGAEVTTAAGLSASGIVVNSFSKYFSMTGWRLGWLVLPRDMTRPIECLAQNLFISPPAVSQWAGVFVFDCDDVLKENVARYARNRGVLLDRLPRLGFDRLAPADGAFYIYADIGKLTSDAEDFCRRMLTEAGVATTPGADFDPINGKHFMRFSFAGSTPDMEEACDRLAAWMA